MGVSVARRKSCWGCRRRFTDSVEDFEVLAGRIAIESSDVEDFGDTGRREDEGTLAEVSKVFSEISAICERFFPSKKAPSPNV